MNPKLKGSTEGAIHIDLLIKLFRRDTDVAGLISSGRPFQSRLGYQ